MCTCVKFGIKVFKHKKCTWNSLKRKIASIKMLVMPQVFLFANPLFYNLGLPGDCFLDLFLFVEV